MEIIKLDVVDGGPAIELVFNSEDRPRLLKFFKEVADMFKEQQEVDDPRANGWVDQYGRP